LEKYVPIFLTVWLLMAIPAIIVAFRGIRKAKNTFEGVEHLPIVYREKGASGYSKKSLITRIGGANKVLDVIVTDTELCIKGINSIFSFIGSYYDLSHRVRRSSILSAQKVGRNVEITFVSAEGRQSDVVLFLKKSDQFLAAIKG